ncbi:PQQ-dependent sugar dehydrogenase [Flavilitoribacter nigricans]|uniref:Glucose dehydrogenase n=1 Tax=Flavilitoribacter nigricans (strain ATCC 23147 / DSM 23189 / NBRC 102662 / NCIMB 1420 / SS-2) TaxID=1122177 RepID=A0A2D0NEL3_FLAN2|nr:PQQ-dependent sugar dehydrogenase [Flavilitoribacter nigricans]PHN06820.1 glucose dehydrogenase [Flavilitoribacter nigricans DSM 23189 = NBRC 102662]
MPILRQYISFILIALGALTIDGPILAQTNPPVEQGRKEAPQQKPNFPEQTRVPTVGTPSPYTATIITDDLEFPWGLDFLPDGRMIVSEKPGNIRIISKDGKVSQPLAGVPPVRYQGSGGMYDLKLAPDFATSRRVFWTYVTTSEGDAMNCVTNGILSRDASRLENVEVIYRIQPTRGGRFHFGSRMLFDQDGRLYVTFGDRFRSGRPEVQQLNSALGKIIRINQDGTPAKGNPFAGKDKALAEIWSVGHRNPQGLAFNPVNGELWETEHGPRGGDEINVIQKGGNYGWPEVSFGLEYNGGAVNGTGLTEKEGTQQPVYYYDPAAAPSGMTFYDGNLLPEWKNNLFVAMLRGMHIARLVVDQKTGRIISEERILTEEGQRFRHVVQGPDGALYALTDHENGRLYRIGK